MATVTVTARRGGVRGVLDPVAELTGVVEALGELPGDIVTAAAPVARQAILDYVTGRRGSLSMSGLGITLDVVAAPATIGETTASTILAAEPWHGWRFVEGGTKAHPIAVHRVRGVKALPTSRGYFQKVNHPGTAALRVWDPACTAADAAVDTEVQRVADEVIPDG